MARSLPEVLQEIHDLASRLDTDQLVEIRIGLLGQANPVFVFIPRVLVQEFVTSMNAIVVEWRAAAPLNLPIPDAMLVDCEPVVGDTCTICLDSVHQPAESVPHQWVSLSRCHHRFHAHCIRQWLHQQCPNCREDYH